eukprot:5605597-Pyramimonas_sp.AAC.1
MSLRVKRERPLLRGNPLAPLTNVLTSPRLMQRMVLLLSHQLLIPLNARLDRNIQMCPTVAKPLIPSRTSDPVTEDMDLAPGAIAAYRRREIGWITSMVRCKLLD